MEQPKRTVPHRIPCYCHKCDGTLVSVRTERNHRQSARAPDKSVYGRKNKQILEADEHDTTSSSSDRSEGPSRVKKKPRIMNSGSNNENQSDEGLDNLQYQVDDDKHEEQDDIVQEDGNGFFNDEEMRLRQNDDNNNAQDITNDSEEENDEGNVDTDPDSEPEDIEQAGGGDEGDEGGYPDSRIESIRLAQSYVNVIKSASLDNDKLSQDDIDRLRNPSVEAVDLDDPDVRLSIDLYMACSKTSESTYKSVRESILKRFPNTDVMSYYRAKALVSDLTGVVSIEDDMCINSCTAFTGPLLQDSDTCPQCSEPRFDPKQRQLTGKNVPRKLACTIPLGPQIQALRRSSDGAEALRYRSEKTTQCLTANNNMDLPSGSLIYDDIFSGEDFLALSEALQLTVNDITVSFSIDGAQLYQNKKSDTWIAIWIINDFNPSTQYKKKHILPAAIIPGPKKPKNIDSFLFRSFYHLSALQRENDGAGIRVWDALQKEVIDSRIIFILGTADAVGLTELDGRVGHHGAQGCRIGCDMKGRHKPNSGHYFAAHLCPNYSTAEDSNHPDYDFSILPSHQSPESYQENTLLLISSQDQQDYERNRKLTGLSKPTILSGLVDTMMLPLPKPFTVDLMHLLCLNLGDLLISLWRGSLKCEATDSKDLWDWAVLTGPAWIAHEKQVSSATPYFPSSFHRPPRNPAEKISSGYKATEYFLYVFGLGPALFRGLLPRKYWRNFCKLVHGVRIIIQREITGNQIREAHSFITQFVQEYELIYYQRRIDRLHFCRPVLHTLMHTPQECLRLGPGAYSTQFPMERAIGYLGGEIRQPGNMFGNLCQIALRLAQINALKISCPSLDQQPSAPKTSYNCRNGLLLLGPRDRSMVSLQDVQLTIIEHALNISKLRRWGRRQLPNRQIARSLFSESRRNAANTRVTRNVKIKRNRKIEYAEVQFYFLCENETGDLVCHALVSIYGPPDADLLEDSYHTIWAAKYSGDKKLELIEADSIISVVSMQPLPPLQDEEETRWFVVEKSGLDDVPLTGYADPVQNE